MLLVNKGRPHVTVGHVLGGMHTLFQYQFTHTAPEKGVAHSSMSYTGNKYYKTLQCCKILTRHCFTWIFFIFKKMQCIVMQ